MILLSGPTSYSTDQQRRSAPWLVVFVIAMGAVAMPSVGMAGTVWSGPMVTFEKIGNADHTLEANQDRITVAVWITRETRFGLFNASSESLYIETSPADTEWAWDLAGYNSGLDVSAANYANLEFNVWAIAHGGMGGGPPSTVGAAGVLYLISDDIYIDILFTAWGQSGSGGSFAYQRSTVPEPGTFVLVALGVCGLARRRAPR